MLRNCIFFLADVLGINVLFRRINARKVRVLMYHGVSSDALPTFYWTHLNADMFRWQMAHLKRHYSCVKASAIGTWLNEDAEVPLNAAVVTFDDGLRNIYTDARPILKEHGLNAICFVLPELSRENAIIWPNAIYDVILNTRAEHLDLSDFGLGTISLTEDANQRAETARLLSGELKSWPDARRRELMKKLLDKYRPDESPLTERFRLMTLSEIRELALSDEFQIGIHGSSHSILSTMPRQRQQEEIMRALNELKELSIDAVPVFAYPNGRPEDFNRDTIEILKELSFDTAFTTSEGMLNRTDDGYRLARIPVGADTSKSEFKARLSGFFYFLRRLVKGPNINGGDSHG